MAHPVGPNTPVCQVSDLKRIPWTYYTHCDELNPDGSLLAHCEVNSKIGGDMGFNSVFVCQEALNCGHYWRHPDGSMVDDSN
ncbi:MAG TPA: hypothetical protein VJ729_07645 [Nitrososphaeraceae archaeon]|nr:hypothetical protein [Nitrososphaeraceae archaeon]